MSTSISATEIGLPDNAKLKLGTGEDLQIYHDSTHSYLSNGTGNLFVEILMVRNSKFNMVQKLSLMVMQMEELSYITITLKNQKQEVTDLG